jgi:hypothetical protein
VGKSPRSRISPASADFAPISFFGASGVPNFFRR